MSHARPGADRRLVLRRGLTLIEVVGVISIIALLFSAVALSVGNVGRTNLRAEANKLASNIQALYSRSVTHNQYYRLVLDFEENSYWSEIADKRFFISSVKEEDVDSSMFKKKDTEKQQAREVQVLETTDELTIHQASAQEVKDALIRRVTLGKGLELGGMITTHQREIREEGKGYLYFFPDGTMEKSLIYLTNGDQFFTLATQPYTGRVKVFLGKIEPDRSFDESEEEDD
ncbi:MAG: type II secretion system protein [Myxococcota bacterium]|nr:type II secretion system protein [Myxococcota bacterium]